MERRRILIDSTIFIEHLRARNKLQTTLYKLVQTCQVETSAIVAAEIFYGARKPEAKTQAHSILTPFIIHPFTFQMAARQSDIIIELSKINKMIDLRDLMIAATALEFKLPIVTHNRSHFDNISGLEIENF
jgi:tRNA(fMet)-specific endonuclease VapC